AICNENKRKKKKEEKPPGLLAVWETWNGDRLGILWNLEGTETALGSWNAGEAALDLLEMGLTDLERMEEDLLKKGAGCSLKKSRNVEERQGDALRSWRFGEDGTFGSVGDIQREVGKSSGAWEAWRMRGKALREKKSRPPSYSRVRAFLWKKSP